MKLFLYDMTNYGIIYIADVPGPGPTWDFNIMRQCILDVGFAKLFPNSPIYNEFNNSVLDTKLYALNRSAILNNPNQNEIFTNSELTDNSYYQSKKSKARLIAPLISFLSTCINRSSTNTINEFKIPVDDTICTAIELSDPKNNYYSAGVVEYATTLGIAVEEAYTELKIEYQTIHGIKMRAYATAVKYQRLIRDVATQEDATALLDKMRNDLLRETFI